MSLPIKRILPARFWLSLAGLFVLSSVLHAQQTNVQVLVPPLLDASRPNARDISGGYVAMHGENVDINGIDLNTLFGGRTSSSTYSSFTAGAALLGTVGEGEMSLGAVKKDFSGVTLHMSGTKYYFEGERSSPRWVLFGGIPVSVGSFGIGKDKNKDEVTVYNFIAGIQGGAALNVKTGGLVTTPYAMISLLGGYREKYKGGTYWDNLDSGGIGPFAVLTLGADLAYLPKQFKLSAIYQRTFKSDNNAAMDSLMFQFTLGWDVWGSKKS